MNEKQVKLLRYFIKYTNDYQVAAGIRRAWSSLDHKARGKLSTWLKKVVVTMMHVSDENKKYQQKIRAAQAARNLEVLKGFVK